MVRTPQHIAIIPDGNRRWGTRLGIAPWEGHREGRRTFVTIARAIFNTSIPYFTFWGASEDNLLKRQQIERKWLRILFGEQLEDPEMLKELHAHEVRFRVIGRWQEHLSNNETLGNKVLAIERATAHYTKREFTLLFGYDGKREMREALRACVTSGYDPYNEIAFREKLWTGHLPDVDLIIRTGEEKEGWLHWSAGFMMWLAANAEIRPTKTLWPDFTERELADILSEFGERERRFGT